MIRGPGPSVYIHAIYAEYMTTIDLGNDIFLVIEFNWTVQITTHTMDMNILL